MAAEQTLTDKQLEIVHDHYKDTFERIRWFERSRDRLFLWAIVLFALLFLEVGYPADFGGSLRSLSILGGEVNLSHLPLPALLNATWVLTLAVCLRYCSASLWIDRQYPYLHALEKVLSPQLGGGIVYNREGDVYLSNYPMSVNVAWYAYVVIFPLIALFATLSLIVLEWNRLPYPVIHRIFDTFVGAAVVGCFVLYRVQPYVTERCRSLADRCRNVWDRRRSSKPTVGKPPPPRPEHPTQKD